MTNRSADEVAASHFAMAAENLVETLDENAWKEGTVTVNAIRSVKALVYALLAIERRLRNER